MTIFDELHAPHIRKIHLTPRELGLIKWAFYSGLMAYPILQYEALRESDGSPEDDNVKITELDSLISAESSLEAMMASARCG